MKTIEIVQLSTEDKFWMAINCYHEAQGEPFRGKVAVCHTVMKRMQRDGKGTTAKKVIFKHAQYSWTEDNIPDVVRYYDELLECFLAVEQCIQERNAGQTLDGADHYYNPSKCNPSWASKLTKIEKIGNHIFMREWD